MLFVAEDRVKKRLAEATALFRGSPLEKPAGRRRIALQRGRTRLFRGWLVSSACSASSSCPEILIRLVRDDQRFLQRKLHDVAAALPVSGSSAKYFPPFATVMLIAIAMHIGIVDAYAHPKEMSLRSTLRSTTGRLLSSRRPGSS